MTPSSYRPRNPGHDYYGRGTYLITLVVSRREHLLARFEKESHGDGQTDTVSAVREAVVPTPLGDTVLQQWQQTPSAGEQPMAATGLQ